MPTLVHPGTGPARNVPWAPRRALPGHSPTEGVIAVQRITCAPARRRRSLAWGLLWGLLPWALLGAAAAMAQPGNGDVLIRMDDRQMRVGGIELARVEPEAGAAEILLPGIVVVPPHQLRVVAAPVGGLLESLEVASYEYVVAGQLIARLRSTELLEAQRLFLAALGIEALARQTLARDEALFRDRVIAERRLLVTRADHGFARTTLEEREQMLGLLGMADADIAELRAHRRMTTTLSVLAPSNGVVLVRQAVPGERVAQAAPLLTVAQLEPLWVNLQVPLSRVAAVENATGVSLPAQAAEGRLLRIGRSADAGTQSVTAVAEITQGAERLRPGQAVTVTVSLWNDGSPQWRVPPGSVVRHRERQWVFVRVPQGFRARPVTVLAETGQSVSVRATLQPGDQIAVRGILPLLSELVVADGE